MDILAILALVEKGLGVIQIAMQAGKDAAPAINALKDLLTGAKNGTVTAEQLAATEAVLDQQIDEFNQDLPAA